MTYEWTVKSATTSAIRQGTRRSHDLERGRVPSDRRYRDRDRRGERQGRKTGAPVRAPVAPLGPPPTPPRSSSTPSLQSSSSNSSVKSRNASNSSSRSVPSSESSSRSQSAPLSSSGGRSRSTGSKFRVKTPFGYRCELANLQLKANLAALRSELLSSRIENLDSMLFEVKNGIVTNEGVKTEEPVLSDEVKAAMKEL